MSADRRREVGEIYPPIFEISRTNPEESWVQNVMGFPFQSPAHLILFYQLGRNIQEIAGDDILGIQVLERDGEMQIRAIIEDTQADTNFSSIFEAGLRPQSVAIVKEPGSIEDVARSFSVKDGVTVGVLKFVA